MSGDLGTIISRIRKNKAETAIVRLVEFHGTPCVDIRVFVEGDDGQDLPTKKGIALNVALIPDVIAALQEAGAEADRRGQRRGQAAEDIDARLTASRHDVEPDGWEQEGAR